MTSSVRGRDSFKITKDLTINATCSTFELKQVTDFYNGDKFPETPLAQLKI